MLRLASTERAAFLKNLPPNIKLSYEVGIHKKDESAAKDYDFCALSPAGTRCLAWATEWNSKHVFAFIELYGEDATNDANLGDVHIQAACFDRGLCYGTVFDGILFKLKHETVLKSDALNENFSFSPSYFSIDGIHYYRGQYVHEFSCYKKQLEYLFKLFETRQLVQRGYTVYGVVFGLPIIKQSMRECLELIPTLPYKVSALIFRRNDAGSKIERLVYDDTEYTEDGTNSLVSNKTHVHEMPHEMPHETPHCEHDVDEDENESITTSSSSMIAAMEQPTVKHLPLMPAPIPAPMPAHANIALQQKPGMNSGGSMNDRQKQVAYFLVKPDLQNDIYHLFVKERNGKYVEHNIAHVPSYKCSIYMNHLFRNIKENYNLDALEESDDEEEFENINIDRFVYLNREEVMRCIYNERFQRWIPTLNTPSVEVSYKDEVVAKEQTTANLYASMRQQKQQNNWKQNMNQPSPPYQTPYQPPYQHQKLPPSYKPRQPYNHRHHKPHREPYQVRQHSPLEQQMLFQQNMLQPLSQQLSPSLSASISASSSLQPSYSQQPPPPPPQSRQLPPQINKLSNEHPTMGFINHLISKTGPNNCTWNPITDSPWKRNENTRGRILH